MLGRHVPNVTFKTRVRDESIGGDNPFKWEDKTTDDYFKGKTVILFFPARRVHPNLFHLPASGF